MLINESGLVRAIKSAYKGSGYTVSIQSDVIHLYGADWYVRVSRAKMSFKALAAIVEHMGMIPEEGAPTSIVKGGDPQLVIPDEDLQQIKDWCNGGRTEEVTAVPVVMQGLQIYQEEGGGACYGVSLRRLDLLETGDAEAMTADVLGGDRLAWQTEDEIVILSAVRKSVSGWAKAWEKAVWSALESVDLHRED